MSNDTTTPVNPPLNFRDIVDWNAMRAQSAQIIADFLTPITTGAASDIQYVADQIARDFQLALLLPPEQAKPLIAEMGQQIGLLAEKNRIRLVNGEWKAIAQGLALAGSIASAFAGAASAGLSQVVAIGLNVALTKIAGGTEQVTESMVGHTAVLPKGQSLLSGGN